MDREWDWGEISYACMGYGRCGMYCTLVPNGGVLGISYQLCWMWAKEEEKIEGLERCK